MANITVDEAVNILTSTTNHWGTRINIKAELFDIAISQVGYKVIWQQGIFCSCQLDSGQPDYTCLDCSGLGYLYINPRLTKVLVTGISGRKDQDKIGLNEQGTAYLTSLTTDEIGFRDRFTFVDFTMKFSEIIIRGGANDDDPLTYTTERIICAMVRKVQYFLGSDFILTHDKQHLHWLVPLPEGTKYSIIYYTPPSYIAINPIHELRGTYTMSKQLGNEVFEVLPKQYQIKREDFIGD